MKTLKASSGLKRKTKLSTNKKKIKTKNKKSLLVKRADAVFGHYIRLRDSVLVGDSWVGDCIDCDKKIVNRYFDGEKWRWTKSGNVGHFYSRGFKELRYDEINCNLQSSYCNAWKDKETMQEGYRNGLVDKYGKDALKELKDKAKDKGYLGVEELQQVIADYTTCLDFYLKEEETRGV